MGVFSRILAKLAGEGGEPDTLVCDATGPCNEARAWPHWIDLRRTERYMSGDGRCEGEELRDDGNR